MREVATVPYERPALTLQQDAEVTAHPWLVFAVAGLAWGSALWYSWWCRRNGGYPSISVGWTGFKVACYK